MARRNTRTTAKDDELDLETTQDELDLFTFLDEIGPSAAVVEIFQMRRDGSRPHCERVTMDVLREDVYEYLRANFGAGKYLLQFKSADRRIIKSKVVEVAARASQAPAANGAAATAGDDKHTQFMREQMAHQQTLLTALIGGLAQRPIPDIKLPDPAAMLTAVCAAFATIRGEQPKDADWLSKVKTVIEIANDLKTDPKDDSWPGIVRDGVKEVVGAFRGQPAALPAATIPATASAMFQPTPAPNPAPAPAETASGGHSFQDMLRVALEYLKQKAKLGKDPEIYVEWIFDNPEEEPCAAIRAAVEQGATVEHLLRFDPEISQNPGHVLWFRKLHSGIVQTIADENTSDAVDTERPAGNTGDAGGHAGTGAA